MRSERVEKWLTILLFLGCGMLSLGIGLTVLTPRGIPVILAMGGSLIAFSSTVALVFLWLYEEVKYG